MSLRKVKYPVWLHADMEHLQNRIFNYAIHRGPNPVDRVDITLKWEKIKAEMDLALEEIDKITSPQVERGILPTFSKDLVKGDYKIAEGSPEPR